MPAGKVYFYRTLLKCAEGKNCPLKKKTDIKYGIKSLSQHFDKEIYQYVNINTAKF